MIDFGCRGIGDGTSVVFPSWVVYLGIFFFLVIILSFIGQFQGFLFSLSFLFNCTPDWHLSPVSVHPFRYFSSSSIMPSVDHLDHCLSAVVEGAATQSRCDILPPGPYPAQYVRLRRAAAGDVHFFSAPTELVLLHDNMSACVCSANPAPGGRRNFRVATTC